MRVRTSAGREILPPPSPSPLKGKGTASGRLLDREGQLRIPAAGCVVRRVDPEAEVVAERLPEDVADVRSRHRDVVGEVSEQHVPVDPLKVGNANPAVGAERSGLVGLDGALDERDLERVRPS